MDAKELIEEIRKDIQGIKDKQQKEIAVANLEKYLDEWEKLIKTSEEEGAAHYKVDLEQYRAQRQVDLAQYRATFEAKREAFRAVIQMGQTALKTSLLINGGAAVALLAFLGRIWQTQQTEIVVSGVTTSLLWFVCGVLMTAAASGITYLSQYAYAKERIKAGHALLVLTISLVTLSLFSFAFGGYTAYEAFVTHLQPK